MLDISGRLSSPSQTRAYPVWRPRESLLALGMLGLATGAMVAARAHVNVLSVALFYLIVIVAISLFADRWTSIASGFVAFLLFNLFFILPYYTLSVAAADHALVLFVFLSVATLTSQLVYRVRMRTFEALDRGRQMEKLNELSRALLSDVTLDELLETICERLTNVLRAESCAILLPDGSDRLTVRKAHGPQPDADNRDQLAVADWVFINRQPAGLGMRVEPLAIFRGRTGRAGTASRSATLYVPVATASRALGVIRVGQLNDRRASAGDQQVLLTFANHVALALERVRLTDIATRADIVARSDELKSALLSAVSHDLRTPLASIKASVTSLLQEDIDWTADDERDLLSAIDEETDRLTRIVSNLLDLSRIEAGALKPNLEPNAIGELLGDVVTRARTQYPDRAFTVDIADELPIVPFDYVEMTQVLTNLIENAVRYSPAGAPVDLAAHRVDETIEITVADRGIGIPPGDEERIFQSFYRVPGRARPDGTGIGLSICRGLIQAHGGSIRVERRPGGGSIFICTLPVGPVGVSSADAVVVEEPAWLPGF
jgi:two-component system sensor histidine kinase KdpD